MLGLKIVEHPLALEVRTEWKEAMPIAKRRRKWRVVKRRIERPGAYQVCATVYMHPELFAKLRTVPN